MISPSNSMGTWRWRAALLLALASAACAPPAVKDSEQPTPPAAVPDAKQTDTKPSGSAKAEAAAPAPPQRILSPAEQDLEKGVKNYEDGDYKVATKELQTALSLGLTGPGEQAKAHKYLAFINCVSGRPNGCREEFRKAFVADPGFDLTPAEAGHPMWGPVFRSVKAAVAKPKPK
jgi:Tfp pilus assembly protein PilF